MELRKYRVPLAILLLIIAIFSMAIALMPRRAPEKLGDEILNVGECIPEGWNCTIITQNLERAERPHGLWEPVAIVNLINPSAEFKETYGKINPSLRLYFYDIAEKQEIMKIIAKEVVYSWCRPIYFDETQKYVIVTSPCYINSGVFSKELMNYYSPLEKSLKGYFDKFKYGLARDIY